VTDATKRAVLPGCTVLPPPGGGWIQSSTARTKVEYSRLAGSPTHTCLASVTTYMLPSAPASIDSLRTLVAESSGPGVGPHQLNTALFEVTADTVNAPPCVRMHIEFEDLSVPRHKGEVFRLLERGVRMMHPQVPSLVIAIDYSERFGPHESPVDSMEAITFLNSLRVTLRDTTVGYEVPVGGELSDVIAAHGSVWVQRYRTDEADGAAARDADEIVRVDPRTRAVVARIAVAKEPWGMCATPDALWVVSRSPGHPGVQRIDAATNQAASPVTFGKTPARAAYGAGSVWITDPDAHAVWRIDAQSGVTAQKVPSGFKQPLALEFAGGRLWVTDAELRQLVCVDPASGMQSGTPIGVGGRPVAVAAGAGALWVLSADMQAVQRIDPGRRSVVATIPVPGFVWGSLAFANDRLWVSGGYAGTLVRIDPANNRIDSPPAGAAIVIGNLTSTESALWTTDRLLGSLVAIPF
jgi:streptogramin lyase